MRSYTQSPNGLIKRTRFLLIAMATLLLVKPSSPTIIVGILTLYTEPLAKFLERSLHDKLPPDFDFHSFIRSSSYTSESYKAWLRSAGMHPVLLDINASDEELRARIARLDALLLTGGREQFYQSVAPSKIPSSYLLKVKAIVADVMALNDAGHRVPIWSTCLGFEALLITQVNFQLTRHDVEGQVKVLEPIRVVNYQTRSARFFSSDELNQMSKLPLFYFNHKFALFSSEFYQSKYLRDNVDLVATIARPGPPLVAWIEFKSYPFFGTQFHPEKFPYGKRGLLGVTETEAWKERINNKLAMLIKVNALDRNKNPADFAENDRRTLQLQHVGGYSSLDLLIPENQAVTIHK